MISVRTSPADLVARILQPLARSLEEARQHLDLERVDEASTDGASTSGAGMAQEIAPAAPAADMLTPRQAPSGPLAFAPPVGDALPDALHPTSAPMSPAAVTRPPARPTSTSPTLRPSPAPASPTSAGFDRARASGPAAPGSAPAAARAEVSDTPTSPTPPAAAPFPESAALRAAPAPSTVRLVHAGSPANPVPAGPARGTNTNTAPANLAPPATRVPDGPPPQTALAPPGAMHAPSAPRQWRLRPSPPTDTATPLPLPAAAPTPPPLHHAGGATASLIPRDPALPRVMQAMAPVFEKAWRLTDAALPADRSEPPPATPEAPRVANHFHVNVALGEAAGSASRDRSLLEEALTALLRDAARRQGLDV